MATSLGVFAILDAHPDLTEAFAGTFCGQFFGPAEQIAEGLRSIEDLPIDSINVLAALEETGEALAPHLF